MTKIIELPVVKNYRDLLVWQQAMQLVTMVYTVSKTFPKEEIYGLTSQIRRAAVSVPANIAEGHARDYLKEYLQFLSTAVGSLAELQTLLVIARELSYLAEPAYLDIENLADKTYKMIKNLQRSLKAKLQSLT